MAALMKVADDYATGEVTARTGHRPMPTIEASEPANGDVSRGRNKNYNRDRKRKEDEDSELVAATGDTGQARSKKRRWENRPRRPTRTYEEIMSGPC